MKLKLQQHSRLRGNLVALLLLSSIVMISKANDADQPIEISADQVTREEPSGLTTYRGSVELRQGSLEINSDSLVFSFDDQGASVITAKGTPATLKQTPTNSSTPINAQANAIEYQETRDRIRLIGDARILQDGAVIEGSTIEYIVSSQRVMAAGSPSGNKPQRVKVTIPPNSLRENTDRD
ncbi:lipopolysaccharide transport periplasmic protein LptA [gamma proteobacterium HIMB55]|nr:lipopolysaccharide transport periplasmic protein LptA [gamma proteobacterium HIMB55]